MSLALKCTLVLFSLIVAFLIAGLTAATVGANPAPVSTSYGAVSNDDDNGGDDNNDDDDGGDDDSDDGRAPAGGVDTGGGGNVAPKGD